MNFKKKKLIKINFVGFWPSFDKKNNFFSDLLKDEYEIVIDPNPDYLFYSVFSKEFLKYDCIRIFYTGECIIPDFNLCDYAMGFDWLTFGDRYIRTPIYLLYPESQLNENREALAQKWFEEKKEFCSFVYSNSGAASYRTELFERLNSYQKVNAGGHYLNNIGSYVVDKREFEENHLFSIACENSSYMGYTTEKILQAFSAHTIPIYWGNPMISRVINEKSFINCHSYTNTEEVLEKVKQLYDNPKLCIEMLGQPIWNKDYFPNQQIERIREFLFHIFDIPIEQAMRRNQSYWGKIYEGEHIKHNPLMRLCNKMSTNRGRK